MTAQEFFDQTLSAFDAGKFDEALKAADEAIAASPEADQRAAAWYMKGVSHESLGNLPDAIAAYTEASRLDSSQAQTWFRLSKLFIVTGQFPDALDAVNKAIEVEPSLANDAEALSVLMTALNETEDPTGALKKLEDAGKSDPQLLENGYLRLLEGVAQNALDAPQRALEALSKAEALIKEPSQLGLVLLQQGLALQQLGEHAKAVTAFKGAGDLMPQGQRGFLWLRKASSDLALNDRAAANEAVNQAASEPVQQAQFFFIKGTVLLALERYDEALSDFDRVTDLEPQAVPGWDQKAALLIRLQRFPEAIAAVDKQIDVTPDEVSKTSLRILQAAISLKQGTFDAALAQLDLAVALDSNAEEVPRFLEIRTQALLALGRTDEIDRMFQDLAANPARNDDAVFQNIWANALLLIGKNREAMEKFEAIASHEPADGKSGEWLAYGNALSVRASFHKALEALDQAQALDSNLSVSLDYLAPLMLSLSGVGRHEEALKAAGAFLQVDPANAIPHLFSGIALAGLEKYQQALAEFDQAIKFAPQSISTKLFEASALIQKGWVLLALKESNEALLAFQKAAATAEEISGVPNQIAALLGQGLTLYLRSKTEPDAQKEASRAEGLKVTNQAVELSRGLPDGPIPAIAWSVKGDILSWLERYEEALIAYRRACECHPDAARYHIKLGEAYERLQDHDQAIEAFDEGAQKAETADEKAEACFGTGRNLRLLQRYEEAIEACRNSIAASGENENILELLGRCYAELDRNQAALQTYRRGWAIGKPNQRSAACALGVSAALLAEGRNAEARRFLEKAEKETTFTGELYYNLGVVLYRLKQVRPAVAALRKAAKQGVAGAEEYANQLEGGGGQSRTWLDFWFGTAAWARKPLGIVLLFLLVVALLPSILKPNALSFLPWLDLAKEWKTMLIPIVLLSTLLLLPILKQVSVGPMKLDVSQPEPQVGRPDLDTALKALQVASPTTALIPVTPEPGRQN